METKRRRYFALEDAAGKEIANGVLYDEGNVQVLWRRDCGYSEESGQTRRKSDFVCFGFSVTIRERETIQPKGDLTADDLRKAVMADAALAGLAGCLHLRAQPEPEPTDGNPCKKRVAR